eukprot:7775529-Alexandrium_andersonii.AAC.1
MQPFNPLVKVSSGPQTQPEGAAVQEGPTGQTSLSSARNRRKSEPPASAGPGAGGAALRAAPPALGSE